MNVRIFTHTITNDVPQIIDQVAVFVFIYLRTTKLSISTTCAAEILFICVVYEAGNTFVS